MSGGVFSLAGLAGHFARIAARFDIGMHGGLERAAVLVENEAKDAMGTYRYGWTPLDPKTVENKRNGDTPLVETGALRDSITHEVGFLNARVYSDDPKMVWQELGTSRGIPPRPVLATAAQRREREVAQILGQQAVALITEGGVTIAPRGPRGR